METEEERRERLNEQKPRIVLNALMAGCEIEHSGSKYVMGEDDDILLIGHDVTRDEPVYLKTDMLFSSFIKFAKSLTDEDIAGLVCYLGLTKDR